MLKPYTKKKIVRTETFVAPLPSRKTICITDYRRSPDKVPGERSRLVAGFRSVCQSSLTIRNHNSRLGILSTVAAREYTYFAAFERERVRHPFNKRRLARAACSDVADADDRDVEL